MLLNTQLFQNILPPDTKEETGLGGKEQYYSE
jgi:hypothetical protein